MKCRISKPLTLVVGVIALSVTLTIDSAVAQSRAQAFWNNADQSRTSAVKAKLNAWTLGLAGGLLEGAPIRFATEIARVADDGDNLHVLPVVTRGPTENVEALLYIRGVDAAIINADVLDQFKKVVPNVQQKISYIMNLFPSELHIFVRPEIHSIQDLAGKRVNFNTPGTAAAYSGPLIFDRLKIGVNKLFIPHQTALEQLRKGDMDAVVFVTSKPVDAFARGKWQGGFRFLPVPYDRELEDYYLPALLDSQDYPQLIAPGEQVPTVSIPTVLAAYNWPEDSDRYDRVARLTNLLFDRIEKLHAPGFHPKWKAVNLSATVPGLTRFRAAQDWLDRAARARNVASAAKTNGVDPAVDVLPDARKSAPKKQHRRDRWYN
jgi:TRAP-type uncharacterized transport system substrate-binding protein